MSARLLVTCLVSLLVACSAGDVPEAGDAPQVVELVDGQAVCDSCFSVRIVLSGPGTANVDEATFVTSDQARTTMPARMVLTRETHTAGEVLVVTAHFDGGIATGLFDLWLDPVTSGNTARIVPAALLVTRARGGPGTLATLAIRVRLSGIDLDGRYLVHTVAGCQTEVCEPVKLVANTSTSVLLPPGVYTFRLDDVAANCSTTAGASPTTLTLERGRSTPLLYSVQCNEVQTPGWVRVSNVTTGADPDEDYRVSCSPYSCLPFTLAANRDTVLRLVPGELTIAIGLVAPNCTLTGASSVSATAVVGDTVVVGFAIDCRALPGFRVTIRTTGREIDPSYRLAVCGVDYYSGGCQMWTTSPNEVVAVSGLDPGQYTVQLWQLAENCTITGPSWQSFELLGGVVEVAFDVTCRAYGTVRVSAVTTGTEQDLSYELVQPAHCDDYYYICVRRMLTASNSLEIRLPAGTQTFQLKDVAANCVVTAPSNPASALVPEDAVVELRFEVACQ
jgi:hypothetical protein